MEVLDNVYVLAHRLGVLKDLSRLKDEGVIFGVGVQGFTNTLRFTRAILVNLPKLDVKFGREIRECMIAREGYEPAEPICLLEDRTKQHYMWPYDPDYVKEMMKPGFDPHLDLALSAGKVTQEQVDDYKSKRDVQTIYTIRGIFKNTNYGCTYGAGAPKIAETAVSLSARVKYSKCRILVPQLVSEGDTQEMVKSGRCRMAKEWILNPVSNFWYWLKNQKDRFSTVNQSTGVFVSMSGSSRSLG